MHPELNIKQTLIWKTQKHLKKSKQCIKPEDVKLFIRLEFKKKTELKKKLPQVWKMKNKLEGAKGRKDLTENLIRIIEDSNKNSQRDRKHVKVKNISKKNNNEIELNKCWWGCGEIRTCIFSGENIKGTTAGHNSLVAP